MKIACSFLLGVAVSFAQAEPTPRAYDRFEGRWNRILAGELIRFADPQETTAFLDYGCSTGAVGNRLAVRFPAAIVTGVDTNAARVAWAESQAPRTRVHFQVADLLTLPFKAGTFDGAFSIGAISFLPDPEKALTEVIRVTRPEGVVAAAVWDYGQGVEPLAMFWNAVAYVQPARQIPDGSGTPYSKKGNLEALWNSLGFRDVVERPIDIQVTFRDFDDYWSGLLSGGGAGNWLASQPESLRNSIRERLRARVLGNRKDGVITLRARAWAVKGTVRSR